MDLPFALGPPPPPPPPPFPFEVAVAGEEGVGTGVGSVRETADRPSTDAAAEAAREASALAAFLDALPAA